MSFDFIIIVKYHFWRNMKNVILTSPFTLMSPVEDILQTRKNVSFELWIFKIPFFCLFPTEQYIASFSIPSISNKRHKCLGSKDCLLFEETTFHKNEMFIKKSYEHWTSSGNKLLQWPLWYDLSSFPAKYLVETATTEPID